MLHAIGFSEKEMPQLLVHGWWNLGGAKMSKSAGNVVDPELLVEKYGAEALRYYLMSDIATGKDADFSEERLIGRYNSDLANSLGNLLNRALNMAERYRTANWQGMMSTGPIPEMVGTPRGVNDWIHTSNGRVRRRIAASLPTATFSKSTCEAFAPWKLAKRCGKETRSFYIILPNRCASSRF